MGELLKTAEGEREFGVDVERGGVEAAEGKGELSEMAELEAELGFTAAALGDNLGEGVASDAAADGAVDDRTSKGALLSGLKEMEEIFRRHFRFWKGREGGARVWFEFWAPSIS